MTLPACDLGQRGVDRPVHPHQVHVEHALEALRRHRAESGHAGSYARVGDHHVEAAEPLHGHRDHLLHRATIGDVGRSAERVGVVHLTRRALGGVRVQVNDRDRRAARAKRSRGREADPARSARHQGDLTGQLKARHTQSIPSRAMGVASRPDTVVR